MTIGSQYWPSPIETTPARCTASAATPASTPEEMAWERRWQAEWDRRNVED